LQLAVEHELRRRLAAAQLCDRGLDALDTRAFGLPRVLYDRNATTGSSPTMRRRSRADAIAMSASWTDVGSGTTAQSAKVSTRSSFTM